MSEFPSEIELVNGSHAAFYMPGKGYFAVASTDLPGHIDKADNAPEKLSEMIRRYNAYEDLVDLIEALYEDRMEGGVDAGMTVDRLIRMANEIVEEHDLDLDT
jgi:hypothetical protein